MTPTPGVYFFLVEIGLTREKTRENCNNSYIIAFI